MPFSIGPLELVVVLAIALIILGPKRLPDAGQALGSGIRNFRRALTPGSPDAAPDEPTAANALPAPPETPAAEPPAAEPHSHAHR
jgi:sec-independent protein translocase protein TatA